MNIFVDAIYRCKLFEGIEKRKLIDLLSNINCNIHIYNKSEIIFRENETTQALGIIISGCIEIQKILPSGNVFSLFYKKKGDMFGGAVMFASSVSFPCNVYSITNSKILFLEKNDILNLCKYPVIANNLLKAFADSIINFEKKSELLSYSSIQKKISFFCIEQSNRTLDNVVKLNSTKTAWAEYLNVSRPSLYRELKQMQNNNLIKLDGNTIVILDREALLRLLEK